MQFARHKAVDVPFHAAKHMRGKMTPTLIVLHDTASRITPLNAAGYLQNNDAKVSCHFVLERDGFLQQQVRTNRGANHAGRSEYNGRKGCNNFSIGIEIVNPGRLSFAGSGKSRSWFGKIYDNAEFGIVEEETPEHGRHWWMPYTEEQIDVVLQLCSGLFGYVDTLQDIQPHWFISPGRKIDTNPLFPLESVRSHVLGRREPSEEAADEAAVDVKGDEWVQTFTPGDALNMRRWPSFNPNVITAIPHGTAVPLLAEGTYDGRIWYKVRYGGSEGWIIGRYVQEIEVLA